MEDNLIKKTHKDYDFTVLTCLFAGPFGLHRLLNGRYVTGGILFGISLFSLLLALIPIIGFVGILLLIITTIWSLIDLLFISTNHFVNANKEVISYSGSYFKNTANLVVITMLILSTVVVISIILNFMFVIGNQIN